MQMIKILTTDVSQLNVLEVLPNPFIGVQIRGIAWQLLQAYVFRPLGRHKLRHLSAVNGRTVPDHQQSLFDLTPHMLEEPHTIFTRECSRTCQRIKLAGDADAAHYRRMIVRKQHSQNRCLSTRRMGPGPRGQKIESGLVNKHNNQALSQRLFFNSGHTSMRHRWMAASSRWLARSTGSCGVQRKAFNNRDTCALWYATPNSWRI